MCLDLGDTGYGDAINGDGRYRHIVGSIFRGLQIS